MYVEKEAQPATPLFDNKEPQPVKTPDVKQEVDTAIQPVVVDGSVYDPNKPYLLVTMGNHTVHPSNDTEIGFDATSGRLFSTVSLHRHCGAIVCTEKHLELLKGLGYPVVLYGQTVAFPLASKDIKKQGPIYPGGLVAHTFCEPMSCHNRMRVADGVIVGDGKFDGCNHISGAYVPVALAIQAATAGDTHISIKTKNSACLTNVHELEFICGLSGVTSVAWKHKSGGSIAPDDIVTKCANCENDTMPLVIGRNQVDPGFEHMIQEISGSPGSYITSLVDKVDKSIGNGMFAQYDKKLESDIREFASKSTEADGTVSTDKTPLQINITQLPANLQTQYCTASMVAMRQPFPIAAPTIVVPETSMETGNTTDTDAKEAGKYGETFSTCSYLLEPHFTCEGGQNKDISHKFGPVAVMHALLLSQISTLDAEKACLPFAKPGSRFLPCDNPTCECNSVTTTAPKTPKPDTPPAVSSKFEKMLLGVSQNIALSGSRQKVDTGDSASISPAGLFKPEHITATGKPKQKSTKCTASTDYKGTCRCKECVDTCKLLYIAQLVSSATHAYQKCDNYVSDQTVCSFSKEGVPQYQSTESMHPFGTIFKSTMFKNGPGGPNDIQMRVGMNTDDCENSGFESKAIIDNIGVAAELVGGFLFHTAVNGLVNGIATDLETIPTDEENLRQMHLGSLPKQDQRRILLTCETIKHNIKSHLSYFVSGSPSKANDSTSASTNNSIDAPPNTENDTKHVSNVYSSSIPSVSKNMVVLPTVVGNGMNTFGSEKPSHDTNDTAGESGGLGGHCTNILSMIRSDGSVHSTIAEGTAPVVLIEADHKITISHRTEVSSKPPDPNRKIGILGKCGDPIKVENCVDLKMDAVLSAHVSTIATRLQVPGASMRPAGIMSYGKGCTENCETFYRNSVSVGSCQMVQADDGDGVLPGADVKTFLNQRVAQRFDSDAAAKGGKFVRSQMGNAKVAYVETHDTTTPEAIKNREICRNHMRAMSPLAWKTDQQDELQLNPLGGIDTLKQNFPDSAELDKKHGKNTCTLWVTHVALNDTPAGRAAVLKSIGNLTKQLNNDYVEVRFSLPKMLQSGEMVTWYKIWGPLKDDLLP